jgi:diacylglycerol kinase (ATP)
MSKRGIIFYNQKSGRGSALKELGRFRNALEKDFSIEVVTGKSAEDAQINLKNSLAGAEFLIVLGGDGLVNIAIQEAKGSGVVLFVHPCGTGNDFARNNFKKLNSFEQIQEKFESLKSNGIDLGQVHIGGKSLVYGQVLSAGFDSYVNRRANSLKMFRGTFKYILALLLELKSFKPISYELEIDGQKVSKSAMMVVVANGPTYGGGMKVLPDALVNDGLLDVMILNKVSKLKLLLIFPRVYIGSHVKHPAVEIVKVRSISIDSEAPIYADGEFFGKGPIKIDVMREHLHILETN